MRSRSWPWVLVFLLWVVAVLNYLDRQVIFSLFPPLQADLGLTSFQLGLLGTMFLWVYGVLSPFTGYLADRFSRRRIIVLSLAVWSVVTWLTGHARNFNELIWARGLMGVSEACYLPAGLALITEYHGSKTRSRAVGLHQSGMYVGVMIGGVGGGWIGQRYGWRAAFAILGIAGIIYALILAGFLLRRSEPQTPAVRAELRLFSSLKELVSIGNFVTLGSMNAVQSIAWWIVYTWLPLHLFERFHMSLAEAGFTATFYIQTSSLVGIVAGGWIADRWSQFSDRGRLLTQVVGGVTAGPFLAAAGFTDSRALLIAFLLLAGIGRGFYDCNTMPVMCQVARAELRATGYGIYNAASCMVSGAMMAVAGALKSTLGLDGALEISGLIVFLSALYLLRVKFGPPAGALPVVPEVAAVR